MAQSGLHARDLARASIVTDLIGLSGPLGDLGRVSLERLAALVGVAATYTHVGYATKAAMLADTQPAGTIGEVLADPVIANRGTYVAAADGWTYVKPPAEADFASTAEAVEGRVAARGLSPSTLSAVLDDALGEVVTHERWARVLAASADGMPLIAIGHDGEVHAATTWPATSAEWRWAECDEDGVILRGLRWGESAIVHGPIYASAGYSAAIVGASPARGAYVLTETQAIRASRLAEDPVDARIDGADIVYRIVAGGAVTTLREDLIAATQLSSGRTSLHHQLVLGQSLGYGSSTTALTVTAGGDGRVMMFVGGVHVSSIPSAPIEPAQVREWVEAVEAGVESPSSTLARASIAGWGDDGVAILASNHARGGAAYADLRRGTVPYENAIEAMRRAHLMARLHGLSYSASAHWVHGEADRAASAADYAGWLAELQADLTADYRALTGASDEVVLYVSQVAAYTAYGLATSAVPQAMADAADASGGRIVLVGARYVLPTGEDGIHLTSAASRSLGDLHAQAALRHRAGRPPCLRALSATRVGATITIACAVPTAPMVRDTSVVTDPGGYGLVYAQQGGAPVSVANAVAAGTTIVVTLSGDPGAPGAESIRIAMDGTAGAAGGPTTGPRACFRDSTAGVDVSGTSRASYIAAGIITVTT